MKRYVGCSWLMAMLACGAGGATVKTTQGELAGIADGPPGVQAFKGIPYAQPPVGDLRWKPPQTAKGWQGMRQAVRFGPRCMQPAIYDDMVFRSNGMSEDCLYLNVWTPAKAATERLPVLVYYYGGGFLAGDGSESRYDGGSMASRGIVALTVNYRLGVFGLLAHPELARESRQHAAGDYGLLDQVAALRWVRENIAAFGGDPDKVTIAGESAGSISVSALMASPLSKNMLAGAIGESGSLIGTLSARPLEEGEAIGVKFAKAAGAATLAGLRAMTSEQILAAANKQPGEFPITIDNYFLPETAEKIYAAGKQAQVPLLAGWNSEETEGLGLFGKQEPTPENYASAVRKLYGAHAEEVLKVYPSGTTKAQLMESATALASDRFIAFSTWKWTDLCRKTSTKPVYRYLYMRPRPTEQGAVHSAEIEYALGNLKGNKVFAWTEQDEQVSRAMQAYFVNFVKMGDPNGQSLPTWPALKRNGAAVVMQIDVKPGAKVEQHDERYRVLDRLRSAQSSVRH